MEGLQATSIEIQRRIASYIREYELDTGDYPTVGEIAQHVGRVRSTTHRHLRLMVDAGILAQPGRYRGYRPA